jgi:3-dehydroquinate synthase
MAEQLVTVDVPLFGRAYQITVGPGALRQLGQRLRERCATGGMPASEQACRATLITDTNVGPLYAGRAVAVLQTAGFETLVLTVPAGDATKSLAQAAAIYDCLADRRHSRAEPVVALGGGMVGDLAGFVAATWLRGVPFVQCPTTVEADVDAGVGGKTAVSHPAGKNLIGAFHQPIFVCIDTDCLATLSPRDFRAGLAESVKHAVIRDRAFFDWHEARAADILAPDAATLRELIRRNCENKAAVVVADERETDDIGVGRAALNFGHTIGHAIEAQLNYELRHGEAVALGMVAAMDLAVRHAGFPEPERARVEALLTVLELPVRSPRLLDVPDLLLRLGADKKVRNRAVRFVVPPHIGAVCWLDSPPAADIERAIHRITGA